MSSSFATSFADWSDLVSLSLVSVAILSNGLDPVYPLWGSQWHQRLLLFATMTTLIAFSIFRFVLEGVHSASAPREFLAISVVYSARWMYLYYRLRYSSAFPSRIFRVARTLCNIVTLRFGSSTHPSRRGAAELILRRGAQKAKGELYFRGKIERAVQRGQGWEVHLVEEGMHNDLLAPLGTVEYAREQKNSLHEFYRRVYETVLNVEGAGSEHVDWSEFLGKYSAIAKTRMAVRADAVGDGDLAGVARRVAADACLFVAGKRACRTDEQIELINKCVYSTAAEMAANMTEGNGGED